MGARTLNHAVFGAAPEGRKTRRVRAGEAARAEEGAAWGATTGTVCGEYVADKRERVVRERRLC